MPHAPSHFPTSRRIAVCASGLAGLLGALSLLGWALGDERLKGLGGEVTMKANTALGLCLLCGSTLALLLAPTRRTLVHSSFGGAVTLLIRIVTFTIIIWRPAQHLSAEAGERQRLEAQRSSLLESERAARQDAERATKLRDDFLA